MIEYIYGVYDSCGDLMGLWTDEAKARAEVDRISEIYFSDGIDISDWFINDEAYGNNTVYCSKIKLNVEWWALQK